MNNEKGFLLFYDWLPALETLSAKDFKTLLLALIRYQRDGTPTPEFSNKVKTISVFILPQIDRRRAMSRLGKMGARARYKTEGVFDGCANSAANSAANGDANGVADGKPLAKDKERDKEKDKDIDETESENNARDAAVSAVADATAADTVADTATDAAVGEDALAESKKDFLEEKGCAEETRGRGYGRYGNVYLSTEEYLALDREIPDLSGYIDHFSEKLHQKGYRYGSHFDALRKWWARDKKLAPFDRTEEIEEQGSFDTDEFFEAAVRRSLGDGWRDL